MTYNTKQWISTLDKSKKEDIIAEGKPVNAKSCLLGFGYIGLGIVILIRSAFKSGADGALKGESIALDKCGLYKDDHTNTCIEGKD